MTATAFPRLPVAPGAPGVAAVSHALRELRRTGRGGIEVAAAAAGDQESALPDARHTTPATVVVATSGSTGRPQRVVLPLTALSTSAQLGAQALGPPGPWLTAVPVTGVGGLLTVLRSLDAGWPATAWAGVGGVQTFPGSFGGDAESLIAAAAERGQPAYLSLVPTQLHRVLSDPRCADAAAGFAAVLVGGAGLAPGVRREAQAAGIRVISTYGATETAGGVVYDGIPLPGVSVRIDAGLIRIGGPTVATGYVAGDDAGLAAGWFHSHDRGEWVQGRLVVLGRDDDVIKVGGHKVSLSAISQVLASDSRVLDAIAVAEDSPEWGQVPHAFVVPVAGGQDPGLAQDLSHLVAAALGRHHRPHTMSIVSQIPVTHAGKPIRRREP